MNTKTIRVPDVPWCLKCKLRECVCPSAFVACALCPCRFECERFGCVFP